MEELINRKDREVRIFIAAVKQGHEKRELDSRPYATFLPPIHDSSRDAHPRPGQG